MSSAESKGEQSAAGQQRRSRPREKRPERIFLVPYPKIIFLYPTFLTALVAAVWLWIRGLTTVGPEDTEAVGLTIAFLGILTVNLAVLTFDFPRATSLTLFFVFVAVALGLVLLFTFQPNMLPSITDLLHRIRPVANATFFTVISVVLAIIYVLVLITVRFNYWEVRPNELLHHYGILSDLKRYSAPHLRIDKEINDVFEYLLLRSGRLILQPSSERRAIILDNVPFISSKEKEITKMLGALQVQMRDHT